MGHPSKVTTWAQCRLSTLIEANVLTTIVVYLVLHYYSSSTTRNITKHLHERKCKAKDENPPWPTVLVLCMSSLFGLSGRRSLPGWAASTPAGEQSGSNNLQKHSYRYNTLPNYWITNWSHIATHLGVLVGATLFKKAQGSIISNRIGVKVGKSLPQVNTHRVTESG